MWPILLVTLATLSWHSHEQCYGSAYMRKDVSVVCLPEQTINKTWGGNDAFEFDKCSTEILQYVSQFPLSMSGLMAHCHPSNAKKTFTDLDVFRKMTEKVRRNIKDAVLLKHGMLSEQCNTTRLDFKVQGLDGVLDCVSSCAKCLTYTRIDYEIKIGGVLLFRSEGEFLFLFCFLCVLVIWVYVELVHGETGRAIVAWLDRLIPAPDSVRQKSMK